MNWYILSIYKVSFKDRAKWRLTLLERVVVPTSSDKRQQAKSNADAVRTFSLENLLAEDVHPARISKPRLLAIRCWDKSRRVVILRRAVKTDLALSRKTRNEPGEQIELLLPDKDVQAWEYAVLVTNISYALDAFAQLYRDRADCENGFDELKNQWGWGGLCDPGH